eukprot:s201_g1.t1
MVAWPNVADSTLPWQVLCSLAREEGTDVDYRNQRKEADGGELTPTPEGASKKKKKKRKSQADLAEAPTDKKQRADLAEAPTDKKQRVEDKDDSTRGTSFGAGGDPAGSAHESGSASARGAAASQPGHRYGHIHLAPKSMPGPQSSTARPMSPSRSPLPRQRADIAKRTAEGNERAAKEKKITIFPPDWRCPNERCQNNVRLVFAKKEFCPICGASRPSSTSRTTGTSSTERMRDARRNPSPDVSPRRKPGDRRAYIGAAVGSSQMIAHPSFGTVGVHSETRTLLNLKDKKFQAQLLKSIEQQPQVLRKMKCRHLELNTLRSYALTGRSVAFSLLPETISMILR